MIKFVYFRTTMFMDEASNTSRVYINSGMQAVLYDCEVTFYADGHQLARGNPVG